MDNWIKVEDKVPLDGDMVLGWLKYPNGGDMAWPVLYAGGKFHTGVPFKGRVTHWMPLPEAPSGN